MGNGEIQRRAPRYSREQVELLKRTIAKGLTDDELRLFLYVSKRTGLDPFLRQIYAVKRWDAQEGKYVVAFQTGIDGYRLKAASNPGYAGSDPPIFEYDDPDNPKRPTKAIVVVYKFVQGERVSFTGEARYDEYVQRKADGEPFLMWAKMPHNQLAKCAEAQALRKAFPAETEGLVVHEEMPHAVEGGGTEEPSFVPGTLYEGVIRSIEAPNPRAKRPGKIAIEVQGMGILGPLGFWETPEPLKDLASLDAAIGMQAQVSYQEASTKRGTYKNVASLAVKAIKPAADEPVQEEIEFTAKVMLELGVTKTLGDLDGAWGKWADEIGQLSGEEKERLRTAYLEQKHNIMGNMSDEAKKKKQRK